MPQRSHRFLIAIAILSMLTALLVTEAVASTKRQRCTKLVSQIQARQQINKRLRCYQGTQWSESRLQLLAKCLKNEQRTVMKLGLFKMWLQMCYECKSYAASAVQTQRYNIKHTCGGRGAAWSTNLAHHLNWCMKEAKRRLLSSFRRILRRGNSLRSHVIIKCRKCVAFAKNMCKLHRKNEQKKCALKGDRWNCQSNGHVQWCMKARLRRLESTLHTARVKLTKCSTCKWFDRNSTRQSMTLQRKRRCSYFKAKPEWKRGFDHFTPCMKNGRRWLGKTKQQRAHVLKTCQWRR